MRNRHKSQIPNFNRADCTISEPIVFAAPLDTLIAQNEFIALWRPVIKRDAADIVATFPPWAAEIAARRYVSRLGESLDRSTRKALQDAAIAEFSRRLRNGPISRSGIRLVDRERRALSFWCL
jgi:hypothetical protein